MSLIDSASAILLSSERRVEAAANNVANASTNGYKRSVGFSELLGSTVEGGATAPNLRLLSDFAQGQLSLTSNPLDLSIFGPGFLKLRDGDHTVLGRGGNFHLVEGGALADADGRTLQQFGGGDLLTSGGALEFLDDGTVLEDGLPIGTIGLWEASDLNALSAIGGSLFEAADEALLEAERSQLRQGFVEQSNVTMSDEIVSMMAAVRQAESGGRIVQFYDQLMGQAIQTFSRSG